MASWWMVGNPGAIVEIGSSGDYFRLARDPHAIGSKFQMEVSGSGLSRMF